MAAIVAPLEPLAAAPAVSSTPKVAEQSKSKNTVGFEHPAFNKVLKAHEADPRPKPAAASPATAEPADETSPAPEPTASATVTPAPTSPTAPKTPAKPEAAPALAAKPLKLQALFKAAPATAETATAADTPLADVPVLTTVQPELATPASTLATEAAPMQLAAPEAFLRWLDTLKILSDKVEPTSTVTRAGNAAHAEQPTASVPALSAATAVTPTPALEALAGLATPTPDAAPAADHAAFGLTVAALNNLPSTASPVAQEARVSTPLAMDSTEWPQQLGEQIRWRLGEGIQEARIEISPRELGAVDVRLSMDDQGLRVHLSAEQAKTRELLQSELPRLRESLQQGGVVLADAQVGREAPGREHARPQHAQGAQKSPHPTGRGRDEDEARVVKVGGWRTRIGLLDDYA